MDITPLVMFRALNVVVDEDPNKMAPGSTYREKRDGKYYPVCMFGHMLYRLFGQRVLSTVSEGDAIEYIIASRLRMPVDRKNRDVRWDRISSELSTFLNFCRTLQFSQDRGDTWETAWSDALTTHYNGEVREAVKQLRRKRVMHVKPATEGQGSPGA